MTDSILIFTFSPIQSFIAEARRAEDLFNGSTILINLAKAAAEKLVENLPTDSLVYPADLDGDVPNVLTAKIPTAEVENRAKAAKKALLEAWQKIARGARHEAKLPTDEVWERIWKRQIFDTPPWQIFWAAAEMKNGDYAKTYEKARELLGAVKHSRTFAQIHEPGQKDSLSGQRETLHTASQPPKIYWAEAAESPGMNSRLRPDGKERLDAIGLVKRFAKLRKTPIPSVSTVAARDFYQRAKTNAPLELTAYRQTIEFFNRAKDDLIYRPRPHDGSFPFDGDLFFEETLTPGRMKASYGPVRSNELDAMRKALKGLCAKLDERPSPYYAIIVFDGDGMGKHLEELLKESDPERAHRDFSANLAEFSKFAKNKVTEANGGFMVYNGGDDVVCLASREEAIGLAKRLADEFHTCTGCTASAGIMIAHHLTPLSIALEEARRAEKAAKALKDKNAVCVTLLKRSGSPLVARSKWADLNVYETALKALQDEQISGRFPYTLERDALTLAALDDAGQIAGLKYLLGRQAGPKGNAQKNEALAKQLQKWAANLNAVLDDKKAKFTPGLPEVVNWMVLARFMASKGGE